MKKLLLLLTSFILLAGCSNMEKKSSAMVSASSLKFSKKDFVEEKNPVFYEIFVRSFADSNGDGIGDLNGVTKKLDYLSDLGIKGIWLMPINPSPSYHGYDVTDYLGVNKEYGTIEDMKKLVQEAHKRNIKVIIDFVVNHTSKDHPWFQKALSGEAKYRKYYNFATKDTDTNAIGEWGQQVWNGPEGEKYESIFWEGMPDLNYDNPDVRSEIISAGSFWLKDMKIDGFRLDAAKHIYSQPYVLNDEEKDHAWWKEFRSAMNKINPNVIMVGEVWDTATVVGPYLNKGLTSGFDFDLSSQIISSVQSEMNTGLASQLEQTREYFKTQSTDYIDSTFITNHDMDRTMSQLNNDLNHAKMAISLLLTLPGTPYLYYGEEIGMTGMKPDESIREPFIWTKKEDSSYQTKWEGLSYNSDFQNHSLETEMKKKDSLYHFYKKLIYARNSSKVLSDGEVHASVYSNDGIVSFKRTLKNDELLVLHNLSKNTVTLSLEKQDQKFNSVYFTTSNKTKLGGGKVALAPYSTLVLNP